MSRISLRNRRLFIALCFSGLREGGTEALLPTASPPSPASRQWRTGLRSKGINVPSKDRTSMSRIRTRHPLSPSVTDPSKGQSAM